MKLQLMVFVAALLVLAGCRQQRDSYEATVPSPDFNIHLYFNLFNGNPYYRVYLGKEKLLAWSVLGFRLKDDTDLTTGMVLEEDSDEVVPGDDMPAYPFFSDVNYNSLSVPLISTKSNMGYTIDFRCFNTGIAFRYRFETPEAMHSLASREASEFGFDAALGSYRQYGSSDTVPAGPVGEFALPLQLEFAGGTGVTILSSDMDIPFSLAEVEDGEDGPLFRVCVRDDDNLKKSYKDPLATPWRFLLIRKTNPDE